MYIWVLHNSYLKYQSRMIRDFVKIAKECEQDCIQMFVDAVDQEKAWAEYLFKDGSMIGLNKQLLDQYIEWIANKRMNAVGLKSHIVAQAHPFPWTSKWIAGGEVQVAPKKQKYRVTLLVALNKMLKKIHPKALHFKLENWINEVLSIPTHFSII